MSVPKGLCRQQSVVFCFREPDIISLQLICLSYAPRLRREYQTARDYSISPPRLPLFQAPGLWLFSFLRRPPLLSDAREWFYPNPPARKAEYGHSFRLFCPRPEQSSGCLFWLFPVPHIRPILKDGVWNQATGRRPAVLSLRFSYRNCVII